MVDRRFYRKKEPGVSTYRNLPFQKKHRATSFKVKRSTCPTEPALKAWLSANHFPGGSKKNGNSKPNILWRYGRYGIWWEYSRTIWSTICYVIFSENRESLPINESWYILAGKIMINHFQGEKNLLTNKIGIKAVRIRFFSWFFLPARFGCWPARIKVFTNNIFTTDRDENSKDLVYQKKSWRFQASQGSRIHDCNHSFVILVELWLRTTSSLVFLNSLGTNLTHQIAWGNHKRPG